MSRTRRCGRKCWPAWKSWSAKWPRHWRRGPALRPFRLVYRAFDAVGIDLARSDEVFELRGFDLAYARRMFPGYVLERKDTREGYGDPRFRVIGEVLQDILVVIYAPRGHTCRLITAWEAENSELDLWYERFS